MCGTTDIGRVLLTKEPAGWARTMTEPCSTRVIGKAIAENMGTITNGIGIVIVIITAIVTATDDNLLIFLR
jgi:hypothetical protein